MIRLVRKTQILLHSKKNILTIIIDLFGYIFAYTIFQFFVSPEFNNHRPNIAIADLASFRASVSCVLFRAGCKFSFAYSVQVLAGFGVKCFANFCAC